MPDLTRSVRVASSTVPTQIDIQHNKSGLIWIVSQLANSTQPFRVGSVLTVNRNGRYITSTPLASGDAATGPPFLLLNSADILSFIFTGMQVGDFVTATVYYAEKIWTPNPIGGEIV